MTKCPLISYRKQYSSEVECMGENCILYNYDRNTCLIRLALLKYTEDFTNYERNDDISTKLKIIENQVRAIGMGFPVMNTNKDYRMIIDKEGDF